MTEEKPAVKALLGVMSVLSIVSGVLAAVLGLAAWGIAQSRTGTEGLAVLFVVSLQWMVALVGGFVIGRAAAAHGRKVGLYLNLGSVVLTAVALIFYYEFVR